MAVHSIDAEDDQFAYRYDTQLLIERRDQDLDEDEISDYITEHFEGNSLIAAYPQAFRRENRLLWLTDSAQYPSRPVLSTICPLVVLN